MFTLFSYVILDKELESYALPTEKEQGIVCVCRNQMKQKRKSCELQSES